MQKEIPEFLIELSRQLNEQPSRSTAHPFYQVRTKTEYITEAGYNESCWALYDDDGEVWRQGQPEEDLAEYFIDNHKYWMENQLEGSPVDADVIVSEYDFECDELPDGVRKLHLQEIEEVVSTHLTLDAAEKFIARKQHDYPKLFTYAESAYWSPQLRELQDWIKSLTQPA